MSEHDTSKTGSIFCNQDLPGEVRTKITFIELIHRHRVCISRILCHIQGCQRENFNLTTKQCRARTEWMDM